MLLRFDSRHTSLADWLHSDVRLALDTLAEIHRSDIADVGRASEILRTAPQCNSLPPVKFFVASEYLLARASRNDSLLDQLSCPLSESRFFELIANFKFANASPQPLGNQDNAREQFLRFLSAGITDLRHILGEVLTLLIRLELTTDDPSLPPLPTELTEIWPKPLDLGEEALRPSEAFTELGILYSDYLGIDREVFWEIWGIYNVMTSRRRRLHRRPVTQTVFWAAHILEILHPHLYSEFKKWVDHFHRMLKDSLKEMSCFSSIGTELACKS